MTFQTEAEFEEALIHILHTYKGWSNGVLKYPTEKALIENWRNIISQNNETIDRLNGCPLTDGEMRQILEQIAVLKTPVRLNTFINGKSVLIKRDNPDDTLHLGKEVSIKIYDPHEIAAGQSIYQIAQQPIFKSNKENSRDGRGDIMLLINGMPVYHIELKRSGVHVSQAADQIKRYSKKGLLSGIFSLVQIFVAMTPEETIYFANPGPEGTFNPDFYFHWADKSNNVINDWRVIAEQLLSIPMAHEMIGFYTVADESDGVLKVLRSYQYYAASEISNRVGKHKWGEDSPLGGYIAHTTGSGKTLSSFKSAQLISASQKADKVIFLVDRIELGTQSLREYQNFAGDRETIQGTEDTQVLLAKLRSENPDDTLIVTSIQKMSRISEGEGIGKNTLEEISAKKIVIIVDEAHRSTFGDMYSNIRRSFPNALIFGFTGTPIYEENKKKFNTTVSLFGDKLHQYSIADGIRDKNVLGFHKYRISTFNEKEMREKVALYKAKAKTVAEIKDDPKKSEIYKKYMESSLVPMAGYMDESGTTVRGIEDYFEEAHQYEQPAHQKAVVSDILNNWDTYSSWGKFHAIFATSSIKEAMEYYHLFKEAGSNLNIVPLFDPHVEFSERGELKEEWLRELLEDYNKIFGTSYKVTTHALFKKDVAARLAHKEPYKYIDKTPEKQINILIVVEQMLTGFDSKWVNTLYLDKVLEYEHLIQAFSRTNRIFGGDKPFGIIRYYRKGHTMDRNIEEAIRLYSGERPFDLFVDNLEQNLNKINRVYADIMSLFETEGISNFETLPEELELRNKFAKLFKEMNQYVEAVKLQGFNWGKLTYRFDHEDGTQTKVTVDCDEEIYIALVQRYKEVFTRSDSDDDRGEIEEVPFEIDSYIMDIDTGVIDTEYMNKRFEKYCKSLDQPNVTEEERQSLLDELHKSFATLTQDEQRHAKVILYEVQNGDLILESGKTLRDYITLYMARESQDRISRFAAVFGLDEALLRDLTVSKSAKNEFGRREKLMASLDKEKARAYLSAVNEKPVQNNWQVVVLATRMIKEFIEEGGYDILIPEGWE